MPSQIAVLIVISGIMLLLLRDPLRSADDSPALWLPCIWLFLGGSRFVSQWLWLGEPAALASADGSPLDAAIFLILLMAGIAVLAWRAETVMRILRDNPLVLAILLYSLLSIAWSDFPFVSFKRYVKALGHLVMALIVVTDAAPGRALQLVLRRCAFVLLPLSILLIKYFPEIGRSYDGWTGIAYNQGAAIGKNSLAMTSMIFGAYFAWRILIGRPAERARGESHALWLDLGALAAALWLLWRADSASATVCFLAGVCILLALRLGSIRRHAALGFVTILLVVPLTVAANEGIWHGAIELLSRDPTLTDRSILWADLLEMHREGLFGTGFEAFWLGPRLDSLWEKWWWRPVQAHNGYLEIYLNLGAVGLLLYALVFWVAISRLLTAVRRDGVAILQFVLLVMVLINNITEASFVGLSFPWTIFYLVVLGVSAPSSRARA